MGHHEKETDRDPRPQREEDDAAKRPESADQAGDRPSDQPGHGQARDPEDVPDGSGTDLNERHEPESDRFDAG